MTQSLRPRSEIEAKQDELIAGDRPETPEDDRGVFQLDGTGLRYDGKLAALEWLLEEPRSEVDVYRRFREIRDSMTTADRTGAVTKVQMDGKKEIFRWALQTESPEDPRTLFEHAKDASEDLFNLQQRIRMADGIEEVELPRGDGSEIDMEQLQEEVWDAYNSVSDAEQHILNGASVNQHDDDEEPDEQDNA